MGNVSNILSGATLLTILEEGISLALKEEREIKEQGHQEVYQEMSDWNRRRLEAEARGRTFTEPPPGHDSLKPRRKKRIIFFFISLDHRNIAMTSNIKPKTIFTGDNLPIMRGMNSASVDLIYLDPPFNSKANYAAPIGSDEGASFPWVNRLETLDNERQCML